MPLKSMLKCHTEVADRDIGESPRANTLGINKATVAELTLSGIGSMSRVELVDVIRAAGLAFLSPENTQRLNGYDRAALVRLAHLARRFCRQQGY